MSKHSNTPELRFPEFDGEWEEKKLGAEVTFYSGLTYKPDDINFEGTFVLRSSNIKNGKLVDADNVYVDSNKISCTFVNEGDVIVVVRNGSRNLIGKHARVNTKLSNTVIGAFMTGIRCYNSKFINSLLDTNNFYREIHRNLGATINQITTGNFKKMSFYFPDDKEKEKIGEFFGKLDHQIELEEKKLELLEQQKRGYMQKIFTQELKFKNSQLENIKWSYKTLEELNSFFTDGNYGESYPKSEDMSDKNDGVAFLRGSNLKKGRITLEDANYISKKKHSELTTGHLFLDDIVIAVRGSLGAVGYVNENMVGNNINSQLAIIRTSNSLLYGKYLLYYLMSNQGKKELLSRVTGTALKQLPIKQIKQIKVPVPKLHEQHKIANFLSELDNLIDNQTEKIELLKERKNGFLQKMFV